MARAPARKPSPPNEPSAAAMAAIARSKQSVPEDKLVVLRDKVRRVRDLESMIDQQSEDLDKLSKERSSLLTKELPDMMLELKVPSIGIGAEGNYPEFVAVAAPYYAANIAASWPEEKRQKAFEWLEKSGHGDMIKNIYTIELGRGTAKVAKALTAALKKLKVPYRVVRGVPHTTLTAFVREMVERENKTPPLDILGATVGTVVRLKEKK